jgi:hypothetical protein
MSAKELSEIPVGRQRLCGVSSVGEMDTRPGYRSLRRCWQQRWRAGVPCAPELVTTRDERIIMQALFLLQRVHTRGFPRTFHRAAHQRITADSGGV